MTNFGTINLTNTGFITYNDGTTNEQAILYNEPSGVIYFWDQDSQSGFGNAIDGTGNLLNFGQIIHATGVTITGLIATDATNFGSVIDETGAIWLQGSWTLAPSSSLIVDLNGAGDYGRFPFQADHYGEAGNITQAGALNVMLNNGYVPSQGASFNVLSYSNYYGNFANLSLPAGVPWQTSVGPTNLLLSVSNAASPLEFGNSQLNGTNVTLTGSGGTPNAQYYILSTTNLGLPLSLWTIIATKTSNAQGDFQYIATVRTNQPSQFLTLEIK